MSATNRGGQRREADFYETPGWCVRRLLEEIALEPSAGSGNIIRAVSGLRRDVFWTACELDQRHEPRLALALSASEPEHDPGCQHADCDAGAALLKIGNFLENRAPLPADLRYDVAIGNPPYSLAMEFVERCLDEARVVAFLLRLDFLGSQGRCKFMRSRTPSIYVIPDRPSFRGRGTDSNEYAWFVWNLYPDPTVRVLRLTSAEEKAADRGQLTLLK